MRLCLLAFSGEGIIYLPCASCRVPPAVGTTVNISRKLRTRLRNVSTDPRADASAHAASRSRESFCRNVTSSVCYGMDSFFEQLSLLSPKSRRVFGKKVGSLKPRARFSIRPNKAARRRASALSSSGVPHLHATSGTRRTSGTKIHGGSGGLQLWDTAHCCWTWRLRVGAVPSRRVSSLG